MARLRNAPSAPNAPPPKPTRQALRDRTNTARTQGPVYENDGNVDDLVKDARPKRGRLRKAAQQEEEFVMTGGLGLRDDNEVEVPGSEQLTTTDELAKSDGLTMPKAKTTGRAPRAAKAKAEGKALDGANKRMQTTARRQATKKDKGLAEDEIVVASSESTAATLPPKRQSNQSRQERSDFSLSPSPPPADKPTSVKRSSLAMPGSALRTTGTPAVESSILALKNFKRRPRQPSMLQMMQQRTASARPSAVNANAAGDEDASDLEVDGLEDEEFAPEAEGTPMAKKLARQTGEKQAAAKETRSSAQSRKRKSDQVDGSLSALDALKAKRRKATEPVEEPSTTPKKSATPPRSSSARQQPPRQQLMSDVQVINSSPSSTPPFDPPSSQPRYGSVDPDAIVPSTEKEQDNATQPIPVNDRDDEGKAAITDDTMAEPLSSSPVQPSPRRRYGSQETDIMADPLTQVTPQKPKLRDKKAKEKPSKPLNTAALKALLPKRRQPLQPRPRKSEYDIDSDSEVDEDEPLDTSHLNEDEDELSGNTRRRTKSTTASKARRSKPTAAKPRQSKAAPRKTSTAPKPSRKSKAAPKTYGKGIASDKENDDAFSDAENEDSVLPDTSMSMYEATTSKELQEMKRKFEDLDGWEMEFESVEVEEGRSSSQLWR